MIIRAQLFQRMSASSLASGASYSAYSYCFIVSRRHTW